MRLSSKKFLVVPFALAVACLLSAAAGAKTVAYPSTDHPSFIIDVPDTWTLTPGKEAGDYMNLESPGGVLMQMRTLEATQESLNAAVKDSEDYIKQEYHDVQLGAANNTEQNGLKVSFVTGTGKDKDGNAVKIAMAWFKLNANELGEIWYAADASDTAGIAEAAKVFNSYRAK
jgi:hypothetical protein